MALLDNESIIVGGWFGDDGQSTPDDSVLIDGWFSYADITTVSYTHLTLPTKRIV